ncbi:MAG: GNAT family N-acetyltransferase [Flavobacteriaceae bacterium]|nr:GNAT family N-acetyltransferase [Flavobacteriaceae bacterium]
MKPIIRSAIPTDMPRVLELINELAVFEKEPNAVKIQVRDLVDNGFGDAPMFHCFVAEYDGKIAGMALVYFRFSTWVGKTLHLEDLIVEDVYRSKGIGMALYERVMEYARETHANRVNWVVLGWNEGAKKFYERTGATIMDEWWQVEMDKESLNDFLENGSKGQ